MLILKYTLKSGVSSRFFSAFLFTLENRGVFTIFLLFSLPLKIGVFCLKKCCVANCLEKQAILFKILLLLFTLENRGCFLFILENRGVFVLFLDYLENRAILLNIFTFFRLP
jgi:hypothetical protein